MGFKSLSKFLVNILRDAKYVWKPLIWTLHKMNKKQKHRTRRIKNLFDLRSAINASTRILMRFVRFLRVHDTQLHLRDPAVSLSM